MKQCALYKVGGSLLDWPDLPARLSELFPADESTIIVCGGGTAADVVRDWDRLFQLGDDAAHQLAMHSLTLTARLLHQLLPDSQLVSTPVELQQCLAAGQKAILIVTDWVAQMEPDSVIPLEHHWQTTSDSLALWLCFHLQIPRLVLVKSAPLPEHHSLPSLGEQGLIDLQFENLFRAILKHDQSPSCDWCNLREFQPYVVSFAGDSQCPQLDLNQQPTD